MSKVVTRSDWGYYDCLDGKDLKDGEHVQVHWPDGTKTELRVEIERHDRVGLGGMDEGYGVTRAYVTVSFRGVAARVRLLGLEVER